MIRRLQTNEMLGDYRVIGFLGEGGMGEVYKGIHTRLERAAAIKVLNSTALSGSLSSRFHNEAKLQSSLQHPNIAALYDFQDINGQLCIFMEFVDGECLDELIERNFFAVEDALEVFQSIVEAVSFTHSNGIIHRDIKSQNIKLTAGGVPKLLDFGIAKGEASSNLTREGGVIGTPNYIAPEQLDGEQASPTTDIWALGILLYELLTGKKPFEAETITALCHKIKNSQFVPVKQHNAAVSPKVSRIVEKCLEKNPSRRYRTANELAQDLRYVRQNLYGSIADSTKQTHDFSGNPGRQKSANKSSAVFISVLGIMAVVIIFGGLIGYVFWTANDLGETVSDGNINNSNGLTAIEQKNPLDINDRKPLDSAIIEENKTEPVKTDNQQLSSTSSIDKKSISVDVIGGSAEVLQKGRVLGNTPLDISAVNGENIQLTLRRKGFKDKVIQVETMSGESVYTFVLEAEEK